MADFLNVDTVLLFFFLANRIQKKKKKKKPETGEIFFLCVITNILRALWQ